MHLFLRAGRRARLQKKPARTAVRPGGKGAYLYQAEGKRGAAAALRRGIDALDDLLGDVTVARGGGVAVVGGPGAGNGHIGAAGLLGQVADKTVVAVEEVAPGPQQRHGIIAAQQIGRASCRERV